MEQEIQEVCHGHGQKGDNGTGGLLVIYANVFNNLGIISSIGSNGGNVNWHGSGGGSGGGSINIFYKSNISLGTITVSGGSAGGSQGGWYYRGFDGEEGSISVGNISTGTYISDYHN